MQMELKRSAFSVYCEQTWCKMVNWSLSIAIFQSTSLHFTTAHNQSTKGAHLSSIWSKSIVLMLAQIVFFCPLRHWVLTRFHTFLRAELTAIISAQGQTAITGILFLLHLKVEVIWKAMILCKYRNKIWVKDMLSTKIRCRLQHLGCKQP